MAKNAFLAALSVLSLLAACETIDPLLPPPPEELDLWADASAGVTNPELAALCRDVWEASLKHDPFRATFLGDPRYNGDVPDTSLEARHAWDERLKAFQERARRLQDAFLTPEDALTAELLAHELDDERAQLALGLEDWVVDPIEGPHLRVLNVASVQPHSSEREREQVVERWRGFGSYLRQASRNLEYGKLSGKVASHMAVLKCIAQIEEILARSPFDSPLVAIAAGDGRWVDLPAGGSLAQIAHDELGDAREAGVLLQLNKHVLDPKRAGQPTRVLLPSATDPLTIEERGEFLNDVLVAVEEDVYGSLARLHDVLAEKILPAARDDEHPGLKYVEGGARTYGTLIHLATSLPAEECDPKALHEYGVAEVRRIRGEISTLGQKLFGISDVAAIQAKLRDDPAMHFSSREEVLAKARESLTRARSGLRGFFGIVPATPCEVVAIPDYEEQDSTIAYYREPSADGSRPGRYYVNTFAPETRPKYEVEVLAFHEAIPGHHLQLAIAQEREALPRFRRHMGCTAFVEGWALYTERLADEMGLYSGDLERLGMLSYDAWRASRLVVDTGIHAFGWTRDEAIEFLFQNTLLARNNVENEVDRYIAWPGQAVAYKVGQREILALRDQARAAQGSRFRYPDFHDQVLENGAVTLETLRGVIGRWLGASPVVEASARPGG